MTKHTPIDKFLLINQTIEINSLYKFTDLKEKSIKEIINTMVQRKA